MSIWGYGRERLGVLGTLLNTHPMALKHLMPALMHFYIGVLLLLPVDATCSGH
jgi:ubiquitin conjugation factor E4 B